MLDSTKDPPSTRLMQSFRHQIHTLSAQFMLTSVFKHNIVFNVKIQFKKNLK